MKLGLIVKRVLDTLTTIQVVISIREQVTCLASTGTVQHLMVNYVSVNSEGIPLDFQNLKKH